MATNAETAAIMLRHAAQFFRDVGERYPAIVAKMASNAETYERVADLVEKDPTGRIVPAAADQP